jgi:hypothetical protein
MADETFTAATVAAARTPTTNIRIAGVHLERRVLLAVPGSRSEGISTLRIAALIIAPQPFMCDDHA